MHGFEYLIDKLYRCGNLRSGSKFKAVQIDSSAFRGNWLPFQLLKYNTSLHTHTL